LMRGELGCFFLAQVRPQFIRCPRVGQA
jgi:hypothetical protein